MSTVRLRVRVTPDDLLEAVSQLDQAELDQFVARVLSLRARRQGPCLSDDESRLLQQINQGLPELAASRYWELMDRRRAGTLTHEEHQELLGLTDQAEMLEAARAEAILELARLRDKPVDAVLQEPASTRRPSERSERRETEGSRHGQGETRGSRISLIARGP